MILFLPPAPHTGLFFDSFRDRLSDLETEAVTYPGYGDKPRSEVSIDAYAQSLLPVCKATTLVGFHTGCLIALEMAHRQKDIGKLILVDIPYFDETTKAKHVAGLDPDNPAHDAFRAVFAYDVGTALTRCRHKTTIIATKSPLFEPTVRAAKLCKPAALLVREDIEKPVFENEATTTLLREIIKDELGR